MSALFTRYSRHLLLPEIGIQGQEYLQKARVLILGAGGLGSPSALYLAAAGIGTLGVVDFDIVDESNLQRQIVHQTHNVGKKKVFSASEQLKALNPHISIECFDTMLDKSNALDIISAYDIVLDGTDNFATRYLVNDVCYFLKKPFVYGSVFRFDGQVTSFHPSQGTGCYRCLYPSPPPPELVPNCAEGGVLGVLPGIVGTLQATEVLKIILHIGEPLFGKLLLISPLSMDFPSISYPQNLDCPLCGNSPTIIELQDYEAFCNPKPSFVPDEISLEELRKLQQSHPHLIVIDVRESSERALSLIEPSVHIPLSELSLQAKTLSTTSEIILYCASGKRSLKGASILAEMGFKNIQHLKNGINFYSDEAIKRNADKL